MGPEEAPFLFVTRSHFFCGTMIAKSDFSQFEKIFCKFDIIDKRTEAAY